MPERSGFQGQRSRHYKLVSALWFIFSKGLCEGVEGIGEIL
jgi:hypothetical protein